MGEFDFRNQNINVTSLPGSPSQDGTDATGVNQPTGGVGIRGWLSGIYNLLFSGSAKVQLNGSTVGEIITLQDAISTTGNGTAIYMDGNDIFKITEISGTSISRTIVFEVCGTENGTYSTIGGVRVSDYSLSTQATANNEIWVIESLKGLWFRTRISAVSGGNVTIKGKAVA